MNIRAKAALLTAGMLVGGIIIVLGINQLISMLTADQLLMIFAVGGIAWFVFMFYSLTLSRLEYEARIKEIRDQK